MTGRTTLKPFIVPVFIPHQGCPHQCVFCNQRAITGTTEPTWNDTSLRSYIDTYLTYQTAHRGQVQISFYGGTFLGLAPHRIRTLLALATDYVTRGRVHGLRCSTRPDSVTDHTLELIRDFPLNTIELGVQSMDDKVLAMSHRGHTAEDTRRAVSLLRKQHREIGLQMMVGLPGDHPETALKTAMALAELNPDFVRIYPTVILKNSPLEHLYQTGTYRPLELAESVSLVKDLYLLFRSRNIPVIRMGLQASDGLGTEECMVAGPYHPAFGHLVYSAIFLGMARYLLAEAPPHDRASPVFFVHPKNISKLRGLKNRNLHVLKAEFGLDDIRVSSDDRLGEDVLKTDHGIRTMNDMRQGGTRCGYYQ